jgi:hypothetical protein
MKETSKKYKEEKSKDIMLKNIQTNDDQIKKTMINRLKLNKELDLSF